jgi:hypothetical protein
MKGEGHVADMEETILETQVKMGCQRNRVLGYGPYSSGSG